jgi:hypothetical protein
MEPCNSFDIDYFFSKSQFAPRSGLINPNVNGLIERIKKLNKLPDIKIENEQMRPAIESCITKITDQNSSTFSQALYRIWFTSFLLNSLQGGEIKNTLGAKNVLECIGKIESELNEFTYFENMVPENKRVYFFNILLENPGLKRFIINLDRLINFEKDEVLQKFYKIYYNYVLERSCDLHLIKNLNTDVLTAEFRALLNKCHNILDKKYISEETKVNLSNSFLEFVYSIPRFSEIQISLRDLKNICKKYKKTLDDFIAIKSEKDFQNFVQKFYKITISCPLTDEVKNLWEVFTKDKDSIYIDLFGAKLNELHKSGKTINLEAEITDALSTLDATSPMTTIKKLYDFCQYDRSVSRFLSHCYRICNETQNQTLLSCYVNGIKAAMLALINPETSTATREMMAINSTDCEMPVKLFLLSSGINAMPDNQERDLIIAYIALHQYVSKNRGIFGILIEDRYIPEEEIEAVSQIVKAILAKAYLKGTILTNENQINSLPGADLDSLGIYEYEVLNEIDNVANIIKDIVSEYKHFSLRIYNPEILNAEKIYNDINQFIQNKFSIEDDFDIPKFYQKMFYGEVKNDIINEILEQLPKLQELGLLESGCEIENIIGYFKNRNKIPKNDPTAQEIYPTKKIQSLSSIKLQRGV